MKLIKELYFQNRNKSKTKNGYYQIIGIYFGISKPLNNVDDNDFDYARSTFNRILLIRMLIYPDSGR